MALRPLASQGPPPIIVSSSVSPLCSVGFVSPLVVKFQVELCNHPDSAAVYYFMAGLKHGFWIGFSHSWCALKSASMNIVYATQQPSVIDNYLQTEIARSRIAGPFLTSPYLHISRFGVIPQNNQLGK